LGLHCRQIGPNVQREKPANRVVAASQHADYAQVINMLVEQPFEQHVGDLWSTDRQHVCISHGEFNMTI
jgi:hypothetical protein